MLVRIKKLVPEAVIPSYAKPGDAGMDITATSKHFDEEGNMVFGTGLAFEIPKGYVGLLFPRSSNAKQDLILSNSVGVLDSGYRGEVFFKFKPSAFFADNAYSEPGKVGRIGQTFDYTILPFGKGQDCNDYGFAAYEVGDRIGQILILPYPRIDFREAQELSDTERGDGGYGSSGK
jgi:dUTP pyrophosphatase